MASGVLSWSITVRSLVRLGLLLAIALLVRGAHAGDDAGPDGNARAAAAAAYSRGVELANQGRYEAALEQFNAAYARSPHFAVLYNVGQAQIALGRPVEAIAALSRYLRDGAEQVPLSRREQVRAQIDLLESRLAELTIVSDQTGVLIRVDDREIGRTPLYQPVPLAAGPHTVAATAGRGRPVVREVTLGDGERQILHLTLPPESTAAPPDAPEPAAAVSPAAATTAPQPSPADAGAGRDRLTRRHAAYALAGAGLLAGGAALGVYLGNRGNYQDWQNGNAALQGETVGSAAYRDRALANNQLAATLTTANHVILGLSIAAGALVAAGATLLLLDRPYHAGSGELAFGFGQRSMQLGWTVPW